MVRPKNETEDLLLSRTKNCQTRIHRTHTKSQVTLEFKLTKARETFSFKPSTIFENDSDRITGLLSLEVHKSIFEEQKKTTNSNFYTDTFDEFSFAELKEEVVEILGLSDNIPFHLQHEKIEPRTFQAYKYLDQKNQAPMVILYYCWVMLDHHFETLEVVLGL